METETEMDMQVNKDANTTPAAPGGAILDFEAFRKRLRQAMELPVDTPKEALEDVRDRLATALLNDDILQEYVALQVAEELKRSSNGVGGSAYDEIMLLSDETRLLVISSMQSNWLIKFFIEAVLKQLVA